LVFLRDSGFVQHIILALESFKDVTEWKNQRGGSAALAIQVIKAALKREAPRNKVYYLYNGFSRLKVQWQAAGLELDVKSISGWYF